MFCVSTKAPLGRRLIVVALATGVALVTLSASSADARSKRKYSKRPAASAIHEPRYADIVVDANTGDVLQATNADALRHPASLAKIMTLYLLFERIEAGKISLNSQMDVSAHAASQAPTKLGVRSGQTLMVEDAIKALVTKSANDAAVVVAEALAGSEEEFATLMTRKARALRMSRTVYKNASGLPDSDQVTTARDQALLGLAIQDRFPRYYRYFATQSFAYRGKRMANHNRLLGRVEGVTGIKTGYTNASGFNLVSAVQRGDRRIVSVVLGGASAGARDARMRSLIEQKVQLASINRTAPKLVETADAGPVAPVEKPVRVASAANPIPARTEPPRSDARMSASQAEAPSPGSTEPIKPVLVKTLSVKAGTLKTAAPLSLLAPEPIATRMAMHAAAPLDAPKPDSAYNREPDKRSDALPPPPPGARPGILGVLPAKDVAARMVTASVSPPPAAAAKVEKAKTDAPAVTSEISASESKPRSGWIIQVGAFEDQAEAREKLATAKNKAASLLKDAEPYTEIFAKGEKRYFRARFAGLKETAAEQVCRQLQKSQIACFAVRN